MLKRTFIILLIELTFFNCFSQKSIYSNSIDSLKRIGYQVFEFIDDTTIKNDRQDLFLQNFASNLKLIKVSNSTKGFYMRIWHWDGSIKYVIDIKDSLISIVGFNTMKFNNKDYVVIKKEIKNIKPKLGVSNFLEKIKQHNITNLSAGKDLTLLGDYLTKMSYVNIQLSYNGIYRYLEYLEPSYYKKKDKASKNIYEFLKYLNKAIGLNFYKPETDNHKY